MTEAKFTETPESLFRVASARTGLEEFGPDDFRDGFDRLLDEIPCVALTGQGVAAAREFLLTGLTGRLRAIAGFKAFPMAIKSPIVRPLVLTGIVRSGTTALHKLLSMDTQFQGPEHWLCAAPQPRPPRHLWPANADFQQAKSALDALIEAAPEVLEDHGMAIDTVEESLNVLAQSFCSNMYPSSLPLPAYDAWYRQTDDSFSYRYFADTLRLIGANTPGKTWLLKNPTDTYSLRQLLNVFPDAMIVQTHRDPLQSIPSVVNLLAGAHRMYQGESARYDWIFEREKEFWALAMQRAETVKATIPGQYIDVQFKDFVTDQMAVVARIYDHFGLQLSAEAEAAMRDWLNANPRRSTSMQRFEPEHWGGNTGELIERFADYRRRYGYLA
jgi:hypothetical protein